MSDSDQKALNEWKAEILKPMPRIKRLIELANFDLYFGPIQEGQDDGEDDEEKGLVKWPGFVSACKEIRTALDTEFSNDIWIECGHMIRTTKPEGYWTENPDYDPECDESGAHEAEEQIWEEVNWDDYVHLSPREIKVAFLGSELAASV